MNKVVLAIDTSNYTTSISVVCGDKIISDRRQLLDVEEGKRGLQQSEAVFKHLKNLPILMDLVRKEIKDTEIDIIGVSTRPRPLKNSYMPVFRAGESFAEFLGAFLQKPIARFSHQEGHIEAGIYSTKLCSNSPFIALHLSGGTTEILKISPADIGYNIDIIGKSGDISAGQFIDRIGVKLGIRFPCGSEMDRLASTGDYNRCFITPSVNKTEMSFSGPETAALRYISSGIELQDICSCVFENIARSIKKVLIRCAQDHNINNILFVGGVSSSNYLRERISEYLKGLNIYFCNPEYSTDNSVGIALLSGKYLSIKD